MPSPGEASPEGRSAVWNGDRTCPRAHNRQWHSCEEGEEANPCPQLCCGRCWKRYCFTLPKQIQTHSRNYERKCIRSCFSHQKLCVCVFVLRKHLHQKQTWVCALIHVKNIQRYLQDVALAMISFSKWICEGGLPSERSALGRPCTHCNHGSSVCQLQASRC